MLIKIVKHSRVLSCLFRSGVNLMHFHGGVLWWLLTPHPLLYCTSRRQHYPFSVTSCQAIPFAVAALLDCCLPHGLPACLAACLSLPPATQDAGKMTVSRRGAAISSGIVASLPWSIIYIVVGIEKWMGIENAKGFPSSPLPLRVEAPFIHVTCLLSFWFLARLFICFQTDCIIITQLFWVL